MRQSSTISQPDLSVCGSSRLKRLFWEKFLKFLHKLPANGDWIYVTESPSNEESDMTAGYDKPERSLQELKSDDLETIRFVYERAKAYEWTVRNSTDHVRSKAATLLSTSGFVSGILLGVTSMSLSLLPRLSWPMIIVEFILVLLLTSHAIRSLSLATQAMTRETVVTASPADVLSAGSSTGIPLINAYKQAISQTIAYSVSTQTCARTQVNKLILGQHAFRWSLIYFAVFLILNFLLSTTVPREPRAVWVKSFELQHEVMSLVDSQREDNVRAIERLAKQFSGN